MIPFYFGKKVRNTTLRLVETDEKELNFSDKIEMNSLESKDFEYQTKKFLDSFAVPVSLIKEARQNNLDGSTLHLEIDLSSTSFHYRTAQNLGIFPQNTPEIVSELAKVLGFDLDKVLKVENVPSESKSSRKAKLPFPSPITVRSILTRFCDFQGPLMCQIIFLSKLTNFLIKEKNFKRISPVGNTNGTQIEI